MPYKNKRQQEVIKNVIYDLMTDLGSNGLL